ncbi:MAG: prepilin-type N-terminal cleavage/methylation domain-containing protein [Agathobacter sp.]|nr:prepilin-type N-terminal cleavage/methylation domain-containing protein [Agathobacter sp.]
MKKLLNKKGFTLMEMLIVVAIIVILVAISVPTFSNSLNGAKEQADAANERAAKVVASSQYMLSQTDDSVEEPAVNDKYDADAGVFVDASEDVEDYGQLDGHGYLVIDSIDEDTGVITVEWAE